MANIKTFCNICRTARGVYEKVFMGFKGFLIAPLVMMASFSTSLQFFAFDFNLLALFTCSINAF